MPITIHKGTNNLNFTSFLFPGGEIGVKLDVNNWHYRVDTSNRSTIIARIQNPLDFMTLVMVKDALTRFDPTLIDLILPYIPYGRQDRVCVEGEAFSLKVFANLINGLGFASITTFDPHSDVTAAVFNNLHIHSQQAIIGRFDILNQRIQIHSGDVMLVSPDAGANKKTAALAAYFNHTDFIRADKKRDLATGAIQETIVYRDDLKGKDVLIADDLCDGGRTFIELTKALKAKGAGKVLLYVTHGLFTKGTKCLYDAGIDEIYTTNSYYDVWPAGTDGRVITLSLESAFNL